MRPMRAGCSARYVAGVAGWSGPGDERGPMQVTGRRAHQAAIAAARDAGWMVANGRRSAARTVGHLGVLVALEAAAQLLGGGWWRVVLLPPQTFVVAGFYSAMHEATHRNLFRSRRWNRASAILWASLLGANGACYREMHFFHHAWVRIESGETAPNHRSMWALLRDVPLTGYEFVSMTVRGTFGAIFDRYHRYSSPRRRRQLRCESFLNLAVWVLEGYLVVRFPAARTGWLLPLIGFYLVGYAYVAWPEHVGLGYREDPLMSARTIKMPTVMRYVYWNNNFHAAHHLAPTVTWDNLPAFTATLPEHPSTTTGAFHLRLVCDMLAGRVSGIPEHDRVPTQVPVLDGPMVRGKATVGVVA